MFVDNKIIGKGLFLNKKNIFQPQGFYFTINSFDKIERFVHFTIKMEQ